MLNLNPKSWHTRLYLWTQMSWDRLMFRYTDVRDHDRTNLCTYIRSLVVKLPLLLALYAGAASYFIYVCFIYPMGAVGGTSYMEFIFYASVAVIAIAASIYGFARLGQGFAKAMQYKENVKREIEAGVRSPGIWTLFKRWTKDKHDRICTTMRIDTR